MARTTKFTIVNPKRGAGYGSDSSKPVSASVEIELACESDADQTRALFALDEVWRELNTKLLKFTRNAPIAVSDEIEE